MTNTCNNSLLFTSEKQKGKKKKEENKEPHNPAFPFQGAP